MSMLDFLGLARVLWNGAPVDPTRQVIDFAGDGVTVEDDPVSKKTLVTIPGGGGGGGGDVASVFGRTGVVVAALADYTASLISNNSGVAGATVKNALETLAAAIITNATDIGTHTTALGTKFDTAGAGLTSTGTTVNVVAGDSSITVAADSVVVGVISDAQHGARGGGTTHANVVAAGAAGFMTGADKSKLDGIASLADVTAEANVRAALALASAAVSVNSQRITNVATPSSAGDAVTKSYADGLASGGWITALDTNITQEANKTFSSGANTWNGVLWTLRNAAAADSFSIVNGTGLVIDHGNTSTKNYADADSAPALSAKLSDLIPGFILGQTQVRVVCQFSVNRQTTNSELAKCQIEKLPHVSNQKIQYVLAKGFSSSAAQCFYQVNWDAATGFANSPAAGNNIHCLYLRDINHAKFYGATTAAANATANSSVISIPDMTFAGYWQHGTTTTTPGGTFAGGSSFRATTKDDLYLTLSAETQNTANGFVATFQRLRVEYRY